MKLRYLYLTLLMSFLGLGTQAQDFVENFNYGATPGNLTDLSSWTGFSGTTPIGYTPTGLTFTDYASSGIGGAATFTGLNSQDAEVSFGTSYSSDKVYVAALLNLSAVFGDGYYFALRSSDGFYYGVLNSENVDASNYRLEIRRSTGNAYSSQTGNLAKNQTHLLVIAYTFNGTGPSDKNDDVRLYVIPNGVAIPATVAAADADPNVFKVDTPIEVGVGFDGLDISGVAIRQASSSSDGTLDGVRAGTSWETVVAAVASPTITVNENLNAFVTPVGFPSDEQSYTVSGSNLTDDITISTTAPFEISTTSGAGFGTTDIVLPQSGGSVANTTIYVRLNPSVAGPYSETISHTSNSATTVDVAVTGDNATPLYTLDQIRDDQAALLASNARVRVRGIVTNLNFNPAQIVIQDNSGDGGEPRGISVFVGDDDEGDDEDRVFFSSLNLGDEVEVEGPIGEFEGFPEEGPTTGVLQIEGAPTTEVTFSVVSTGNTVTPFVATLSQLDEDLESTLVQVNNVSFSAADADFEPGYFRGETTYTISDASDPSFDLRLDISTDITRERVGGNDYFRATPIPTSPITLRGIVGHFSSDRQIIPRDLSDVGSPTPVSYLNGDNLDVSDTDILTFVTWNLLWFGDPDVNNNNPHGSTEAEQLSYIANIILTNDWDLIAVQEVMESSDLASLVTVLNALVPGSYGYHHFDRGSTLQDLGFIYKTSQIVSDGFQQLTTGLTSSNWANGRYPVEMTFSFNGESFTVINVHLKAGDESSDLTQRTNAITELKAYTDGLSGNVVILGDMNDRSDENIFDGGDSPLKPYVDDNEDYTGVTEFFADYGLPTKLSSTLNSPIDHIFVNSALADNLILGTTFPFYGEQFDNYRGTTSDHYPVVTRMAFGEVLSNEYALAGGNAGMGVYPNPASSTLNLTFNLTRTDVATVVLYDQTGRPVRTLLNDVTIESGEQTKQVNVSDLQTGLYYARASFRSSGQQAVIKVLIAR